MQTSQQKVADTATSNEERSEIFSRIFQSDVSSFMQLEWLLDAIEQHNRRETCL
ncbi:hypothetical protein ROA7745_03188 [Roseovarius aestuarii]|uniref:Uncharacterized protein n=1 Tax=Roseovarius aestuarii TaxID=475083 RepID=A0A1X7BUN3_9RHOB|nr:hypothetical protein ROA7745_03188 [Roseovarius aestuarii]